MLDFIFSSTGPELQITLKIVGRVHVFPKVTYTFYFISSFLLKNKQKTPNPEYQPSYQDSR